MSDGLVLWSKQLKRGTPYDATPATQREAPPIEYVPFRGHAGTLPCGHYPMDAWICADPLTLAGIAAPWRECPTPQDQCKDFDG